MKALSSLGRAPSHGRAVAGSTDKASSTLHDPGRRVCSMRRLRLGHGSHTLMADVIVCLLLQACIAGGGQMIEHWLAPESPCCAPRQVL